MARVIIREQDLTGNVIDQDFTDIAFIPGFVKYPKEEYSSPQLCIGEDQFIDMFGNEPALAYSNFVYDVTYVAGRTESSVLNPETGTELFYLSSKDVESLSDPAYHYARELLYRGLPVYYGPMNAKDDSGKLKTYDGNQTSTSTGPVKAAVRTTYVEPVICDGGNKVVSIPKAQKVKFQSNTADATYAWIVNGSVASETSNTFNPKIETTGTIVTCIATTGSGSTKTEVKTEITTEIISDSATLVIKPKGNTDALNVSTQTGSEKYLTEKDADSIAEITAGVQPQVVSYNQDVNYTVQVIGTNVQKFSYFWYITPADGEKTLLSTNQICKFSSSQFKPGTYTISVEVWADPSVHQSLGHIIIEKVGKDLTTPQVIAAAKAKAIDAAIIEINKQFAQEMIDFFNVDDNIELLKDRGLYNFKYFTTGGYPLFEAAIVDNGSDGTTTELRNWNKALTNLLSICGQKTTDDAKDTILEDGSTQRQGRGDCVLLIDHAYDKSQDTMVLYDRVREWFEDPSNVSPETLEFAAMFTPWCNYSMTYTSHNVNLNLPASFAYLSCLADSIQAYDNWHAIAGVTRGTVKNLNEVLLTNPLTNTKANKCQADPETAEAGRVSINCITEIKPYGQVIWGNRTLQRADSYKHVTAMGFLNLRNEVSDIKKLVYRAARRWMFEQNTSILWINFKSTITPLLERMVHGYGLTRYEIRRGEKTKKHKLYAEIRIWPIYAVEYIDVTIQILDEETIVTEE